MTSRIPRIASGAGRAAPRAAAPAPAGQPGDAWVTTRVKLKLVAAEGIDPFDIDVDTFDGAVTLHGRVETPEQRQQAEELAGEVDGVASVRNLLAVVPAAAADAVAEADGELREEIETVLERDAALEESDIDVASVTDGIVVLSGTAESVAAHERALEDARSVAGVRGVASEIRSPGAQADRALWSEGVPPESNALDAVSDAWISARAQVGLMAAPGLSPLAVDVDTRDGVVTLFGMVTTEDEKALAQREVERIDGVQGVENELQIVPEAFVEQVEARDERVLGAVQQRLDASPALQRADIDVEVSNGVVRLTGTVESLDDKVTALAVARTTDGVDSIVDGLRIDGDEKS
jgi:hyperosmotically inducible protein